MVTTTVETVVVGAGIAGLAYAHARGADADLVVLEHAGRAGGLIETQRLPDDVAGGPAHVELGPEALQGNAPETLALLQELGLAPLPAAGNAKHRFLLTEGDRLEPAPLSPGAFLKTPMLSWRGKLRALSEPFRARERALDGSIADFVRHRLGHEVLDVMVDPMVGGVYAGDPSQLSLRAAFPKLYDAVEQHGGLFRGLAAGARKRKAARRAAAETPGEVAGESSGGSADRSSGGSADMSAGASSAAVAAAGPAGAALFSVMGGLERLVDELAAALGSRLHLHTSVAEVTRTSDGQFELLDAEGGRWRAARCVMATPVASAARLLDSVCSEAARELSTMERETVLSLAHLWRREDIGHPLDGFGYLVAARLGRQHLGTLFSSSVFPSRCPAGFVLLRTLLGGARRPDLAELPDEALVSLMESELSQPLDLAPGAAPVWTGLKRWRAVLPRYDLGHPARTEQLESALAATPGLHVIGNHRRGISVNALIESSRALASEHG